MGPVSLFLLVVAAIFVIGVAGELFFQRTGVPDVVWLMLMGIALGPIAGFAPRDDLIKVAPYFGALTLVVVLFDGGSKLKLGELRAAAWRSSLLAVLTFLFSVAAVFAISMVASFFGVFGPDWTWLHGVMLGSILGGSSSVVIMPALRKAGLSPNLANLVNLESAITDVLCVVSTVACVNIAVSGQANMEDAGIALAKAFGIGLGVGLMAGLLGMLLLRPLKRSNYAYPVTLGALLILYVLIDELGGSAALGILACAVLMGNAPELSKVVGLAKTARMHRSVTSTHDEITFIIKSFFFTFLGAMLRPPVGLLLLGVLLGLFLFIARIPGVFLGTLGAGMSVPARGLVVVSLPRGMAAGVLAMLPFQAGVKGSKDMPIPVFAAVFTTIMIFSVGFPVLKGILKRMDPDALADPLENERGIVGLDAHASTAEGSFTLAVGRGAADATVIDDEHGESRAGSEVATDSDFPEAS